MTNIFGIDDLLKAAVASPAPAPAPSPTGAPAAKPVAKPPGVSTPKVKPPSAAVPKTTAPKMTAPKVKAPAPASGGAAGGKGFAATPPKPSPIKQMGQAAGAAGQAIKRGLGTAAVVTQAYRPRPAQRSPNPVPSVANPNAPKSSYGSAVPGSGLAGLRRPKATEAVAPLPGVGKPVQPGQRVTRSGQIVSAQRPAQPAAKPTNRLTKGVGQQPTPAAAPTRNSDGTPAARGMPRRKTVTTVRDYAKAEEKPKPRRKQQAKPRATAAAGAAAAKPTPAQTRANLAEGGRNVAQLVGRGLQSALSGSMGPAIGRNVFGIGRGRGAAAQGGAPTKPAPAATAAPSPARQAVQRFQGGQPPAQAPAQEAVLRTPGGQRPAAPPAIPAITRTNQNQGAVTPGTPPPQLQRGVTQMPAMEVDVRDSRRRILGEGQPRRADMASAADYARTVDFEPEEISGRRGAPAPAGTAEADRVRQRELNKLRAARRS